jgi:hypothetical protein
MLKAWIIVAIVVLSARKPILEGQLHAAPSESVGQQTNNQPNPAEAVSGSNPQSQAAAQYNQSTPRSDPCDSAERWLVGVGIAGIIVALGTLGIIYKQTKASEKAASAAIRNIEIIIDKERARIKVVPETLHLPGGPPRPPAEDVPNYPAVSFRVTVRGVTDAINIKAHAQAKITDSRTLDRAGLGIIISLPDTLSSNVSLLESTPLLNRWESKDILDVHSGKQLVHFWGRITYNDIFSGTSEHETTFQYIWETYPPVFGNFTFQRSAQWEKNGGEEDNRET